MNKFQYKAKIQFYMQDEGLLKYTGTYFICENIKTREPVQKGDFVNTLVFRLGKAGPVRHNISNGNSTLTLKLVEDDLLGYKDMFEKKGNNDDGPEFLFHSYHDLIRDNLMDRLNINVHEVLTENNPIKDVY